MAKERRQHRASEPTGEHLKVTHTAKIPAHPHAAHRSMCVPLLLDQRGQRDLQPTVVPSRSFGTVTGHGRLRCLRLCVCVFVVLAVSTHEWWQPGAGRCDPRQMLFEQVVALREEELGHVQVQRGVLKRSVEHSLHRGEDHVPQQQAEERAQHASLAVYTAPAAVLGSRELCEHQPLDRAELAAEIRMCKVTFAAALSGEQATRECERRSDAQRIKTGHLPASRGPGEEDHSALELQQARILHRGIAQRLLTDQQGLLGAAKVRQIQ
mmetsp:Transcript_24353/g.61041  ORF Transcript_24353/g.61041 Transcript_24353/m.61041 type:complete len:267 (+) Transcript_24353:225-1025(+)